MGLQGQVGRRAGYAMAALLVALGVMSVLLTVAMPVWRQLVQREKEEELIFRGQQYARSIGLFQRKYAAAYPPDVDTLVRQKFLRKKYKDPMAADGEFLVLYQSSLGQAMMPGLQQGQRRRGQFGRQGQPAQPGQPGQAPQQGQASQGDEEGQGQQPGLPGGFGQRAGQGNRSSFGFTGGQAGTIGPRGGVIGVASKSTETSIRLYNGRNHYNEWQFVYAPSMFGPGQARPGMRPGQRLPLQQQRPGARPGTPSQQPPLFQRPGPGNPR